MKHKKNFRLSSIALLGLTLAACGGGGGGGNNGGGSVMTMQSRALTLESLPSNALQEAADSTKSTNQAATAALIGLIQDRETFCQREPDDTADCSNLSGPHLSDAKSTALTALVNNSAKFRDLSDEFPTGLAAARDVGNIGQWWGAGWTGKNVKLGVIDDFANAGNDIDLFGNGGIQLAHGHSTQFIMQQIAPEAEMARRQVSDDEDGSFEGNRRFERTFFAQVRELSEDGFNIINASLSINRLEETDDDVYRLKSAEYWNREIDGVLGIADFNAVARADGAADEDLLLVLAAGNDGTAENDDSQACTGGIKECNLWAAAIDKMRRDGNADAGNRFLFVGSVDVDTNRIKDYSVTAGEMTHDFIVAGDRIFNANEEDNGTSQAAPRVAGAAVLMRHRWPNLNGAQLKHVLLATAEDLGAEGPDAVYGHGRLSLDNALSPVGGMSR